jgi:hypothetical protein
MSSYLSQMDFVSDCCGVPPRGNGDCDTSDIGICPECGEMEKVLIDEDNTIKEYSCYKRLSHFKEWLTQIQAKESPDIDDETFEIIVKEIIEG